MRQNAEAACALIATLALTAALAAPTVTPSPDIAGVWWSRTYQPRLLPADGAPLPFTPEGRARYEKIAAGLKSGSIVDEAVHTCLPEGMPRAMTGAYPFQIISSPGQITFAHQANRAYRMVQFADQHEDPKVWDPSYMGDGIAKWDGDTLIIDSTNFKSDRIYLDSSGLPASDQLHLVERLRLINGGKELEDLITIEDPVIFTKTWTARLKFSRRDDMQLKTDWVCGEKHLMPDTRAQARPRSSGEPNLNAGQMALNGYWGTWKRFLATTAGGKPPQQTNAQDFAVAATKLQPWAKAKRDKEVATDAAGQFVPSNTTTCYPDWIAGSGIFDAYGIEILIAPKQVTFLSEAGRATRFVYIGQTHPANLAPSWMGHSIGHWEGDTLVVDTIGFNDRASLPFRVPMSSQMHVVERLRVENDVLEDQAVFDDPGAFTAPFTVTTHFDRSKPYQEYICAENNHEGGVPTSTGATTKSDLPKDNPM
jgi:hypothetical protein